MSSGDNKQNSSCGIKFNSTFWFVCSKKNHDIAYFSVLYNCPETFKPLLIAWQFVCKKLLDLDSYVINILAKTSLIVDVKHTEQRIDLFWGNSSSFLKKLITVIHSPLTLEQPRFLIVVNS